MCQAKQFAMIVVTTFVKHACKSFVRTAAKSPGIFLESSTVVPTRDAPSAPDRGLLSVEEHRYSEMSVINDSITYIFYQ